MTKLLSYLFALLFLLQHVSLAPAQNSLRAAIASEYPLPLRLMADGDTLLCRRLTFDFHQSIAVRHLHTGAFQNAPDMPGEILRAEPNQQGTQVAFYFQGASPVRQLYVWDIASNALVPFPVYSSAEIFLLWSPDGHIILTADDAQGLLLTNIVLHTTARITTLPVRTAAFSRDASQLAYVTVSSPKTVVITNASGTILKGIATGTASPITDLKWSPTSFELAAVSSNGTTSEVFLVSTNGGTPFHLVASVVGAARDLLWADPHHLLFITASPGSSENILYDTNPVSSNHVYKRSFAGILDLRGFSQTRQTIGFVVRTNAPANFQGLILASHQIVPLMQTRTPLPLISAHSLSFTSAGVVSTASLWQRGTPSRAIFRFHGRGADEYPVWQPDIQYFANEEVAYISMEYDSTRTNDHSYQDTIEHFIDECLQGLHIPRKKAVLFGYSAGADFILDLLTHSHNTYAGAVLVGLNTNKNKEVLSRDWGHTTPLHFVKASEDTQGDITSYPIIHSQTILTINDTHLLVHLNSWLAIQELLASAASR